MIRVIAIVTAHPGQRDAVLTAFRDIVPAVRAEAGCIEYTACVDLPGGPAFQAPVGPDTLVILEQWADMDSLVAHARAPHMRAYGAKVKDLVASRAIHLIEPAA